MKFTLPLSPNYCEHWGIWEAIREIYQNALDAGGASIKYNPVSQRLDISSASGRLTPETLVLGTTSKRDQPGQRGKFGEGYKLALLVLARLEHKVVIHTGEEIWISRLTHSDQFNATVLTINTSPAKYIEGTHFYVYGIPSQIMNNDILPNIRTEKYIANRILNDDAEIGRIYVGGLYVTTAKNFKHGYSFTPGTISLDRDRGMIRDFDLAYETSKLWTAQGHSARLSELLESEAPDVEYVDSHVSSAPSFAGDHYNYFVHRHGSHAVPVSNQEEIQRASAAGMKWVLVPEKVKALYRLVKSWVIPTTETVAERLQKFKQNYGWSLSRDAQQELDEIIETLTKKE